MANDHCVGIGSFFFDVQLDCAAAHVHRAGNMLLVPFVFLANINDQRFTALHIGGCFSWRSLRDLLLRLCDEFLEPRVLSHTQI